MAKIRSNKVTYMTSGQLADYLEVNVETLRYYERINLIPDVKKDTNGYKQYDSEQVRRLIFILVCKDMGFTLNEIKGFFSNSTYTDIMNYYKEHEGLPADLEDNIRLVVKDKIVSLQKEITTINEKIENLNGFIRKLDKAAIVSEKACKLNK